MVLQIRREEESHINRQIQDFFRGSQGPLAPEFLPVHSPDRLIERKQNSILRLLPWV